MAFKIVAAFRVAGGRLPMWKLDKILGINKATLNKYLLWLIAHGVIIPPKDETAEFELVFAEYEWVDEEEIEEILSKL